MSAVTPQHDLARKRLREALFEGRLAPGQAVTVAALAAELGLGTMPVREALRQVTAEGGFEASATRRLSVPDLTSAQLTALIRARALLEPEAAVAALPHISAGLLTELARVDAALSDAIRQGDRAGYMRLNFRFHFSLYRADPGSVLVPLVESLWLKTGPHMSRLFDRAPGFLREDRHQQALGAIRRGTPDALRAAIAGDISDALEALSLVPALP
ncbi:GntR family transcriptional regulator [Falsigemmobacter faecalis]|uniref:GntR family transcriptional regulator n=1 Tax=Falsigemmobacter faecalis TaxID=2488730 RepID=A0A3P3DW72_9RHOB|nr:GntR family transcriptional regulator [Falsigemmobacter faecalis]RRH77996.1 GntR family transcriptional regulator [Falsigemmobacter faecalis]